MHHAGYKVKPMTAYVASQDLIRDRHAVIMALCAALLVVGPLFLGGNRPLSLMVLELLAGGVILTLGRQLLALSQLPRLVRVWLVVIIALPGCYLLPLPFSASGTEIYAQVHQLVGVDSLWRPLAVVPAETERSWYALMPALAMFTAIVVLPARYLPPLILIAIWVAAGEALLGVMQYLSGPDSALRFGIVHYPDSAIGTFANRNHLAGLLEMSLPVALAWMVLAASDTGRSMPFGMGRARSKRWNLRLWASAAVVVLLLVGLVLTRSRAGMALAVVGLLASAALIVRAGGVQTTLRPLVWAGGVGIVLLILLGLVPILMRFVTLDPLHDVRWTVFARTMELAGIFFPFGSGPGSFASVFPRVQPPDLRFFINHAHNDYLEWLVEVGFFAIVLVVGFAVALGQRGWALWRRGDHGGEASQLIQLAAGIGVLVIAAHGLVDFNLRIPANQIFFAFWAAVFFRAGWGQRTPVMDALDRPSRYGKRPVEPLGVRLPGPGVKNPFSE